MQVLETELATSQEQSTCTHNDLKSEAARVRAQLEAESMATSQQLERVEEANKALAQQQQIRIQVRATYLIHHNLQETQASSPAPEPSEYNPSSVSERHQHVSARFSQPC